MATEDRPAEGSQPAPKRARKAGADEPAAAASIFSPDLLSPGSRAALRAQYRDSQPYTHGVLAGLLPPATLAAVRNEIVHNIQATYKETDLFKVFQTGAWWRWRWQAAAHRGRMGHTRAGGHAARAGGRACPFQQPIPTSPPHPCPPTQATWATWTSWMRTRVPSCPRSWR